ncbi:MAG TPA: glutaredoxin [Capillimicrobium sp.]|jgi:glutaredoxin
MLQLFQAEWCPFSHLVRQRLTELGVDFVARQVEPDPEDRDALEQATGLRTIPVAVFEDGEVVGGDAYELIEVLDARFDETASTPGHQERRSEARVFES